MGRHDKTGEAFRFAPLGVQNSRTFQNFAFPELLVGSSHVSTVTHVPFGAGGATLLTLGCPPDAAYPYCATSPNSVGSGALMGASGSVSFADNAFTVRVSGAPTTVGLFFYGSVQTQTPVGNGNLCIAGQTFRMNPASMADGAGNNSRTLDFTSGSTTTGSGTISPDSTWFFQYWYRDVAAGGAQFNFSDGLQVNFTL